MHNIQISEQLREKLRKLAKKDKGLHEQVKKKIKEILSSPTLEHYKNLRYDKKDSKRVHIGSLVLIFQYNENNDEVLFDDFDHHDFIYKK